MHDKCQWVFKYLADKNSNSSPDIGVAWNAGDVYIGELKAGLRHGPSQYTFFSRETMNCEWKDGLCPDFTERQKAVQETRRKANIVFANACTMRFSIVRNAFLLSASAENSLQALAPSVLRMCEDALLFGALGSSSTTLEHLLICDLVAAATSITDVRQIISDCMNRFIQTDTSRSIKLYVGLHASFESLWKSLLPSSQHPNLSTFDNCLIMYKQHAEFLLKTVSDASTKLLSTAAGCLTEVVEAFGDACKASPTASLESFAAQDGFRWQVARLIVRGIPRCETSTVSKKISDFVLMLSGLAVVKGCVVSFDGPAKDAGASFLQDLHLAYFLGDSQEDSISVASWTAASACVDNILRSHSSFISGFGAQTLIDIRSRACDIVLTQISNLSRSRLCESIIEDLLNFADDVRRVPVQTWSENQEFVSVVHALSPWTSLIQRAPSFNHSYVMQCIMKHRGRFICLAVLGLLLTLQFSGTSFTKGSACSSFIETIFKIDCMLVHVAPAASKCCIPSAAESRSPACSATILRDFMNVLIAARACFQRFSVSVSGLYHVTSADYVVSPQFNHLSLTHRFRCCMKTWRWLLMLCARITNHPEFSSFLGRS
jgi:hypothetical protein